MPRRVQSLSLTREGGERERFPAGGDQAEACAPPLLEHQQPPAAETQLDNRRAGHKRHADLRAPPPQHQARGMHERNHPELKEGGIAARERDGQGMSFAQQCGRSSGVGGRAGARRAGLVWVTDREHGRDRRPVFPAHREGSYARSLLWREPIVMRLTVPATQLDGSRCKRQDAFAEPPRRSSRWPGDPGSRGESPAAPGVAQCFPARARQLTPEARGKTTRGP